MTVKSKAYEFRHKILRDIGLKNELIQRIPKEIMEKLENCYYYGTPMNVFLEANLSEGKCYDRSYGLTMAFDKFNLVRGYLMKFAKTFPNPKHDKNFGHGWVESEGWCYDTTFNIRVKSWFYKFWLGAKESERYSEKELFEDEEYMKLRKTTKSDIENDYGLEAFNAYLCKTVLQLYKKESQIKTENSTRTEMLERLICQLPNIDMEEIDRRVNVNLQEIIERTRSEER
ncbi:MAG: hypothetical protein FWF46_06880 [Oscillospiraceae bacterium]|nr:hypothetical protein [Oscillospiraceae bacterium]